MKLQKESAKNSTATPNWCVHSLIQKDKTQMRKRIMKKNVKNVIFIAGPHSAKESIGILALAAPLLSSKDSNSTAGSG